MTVPQVSRDIYDNSHFVQLVKKELEGIAVSDAVLTLILDKYVEIKRSALLSGHVIFEEGIGHTRMQTRGVPKRFSPKGYTVKVDTLIDPELRDKAMSISESDETYKELLDIRQ